MGAIGFLHSTTLLYNRNKEFHELGATCNFVCVCLEGSHNNIIIIMEISLSLIGGKN